MRKLCYCIVFFTSFGLAALTQNAAAPRNNRSRSIDSLKSLIGTNRGDSATIFTLERIGFYYERFDVDSSLKYFNEALTLARNHSLPWAEARILAGLSGTMEHRGKYAEALELLFRSVKIARESNNPYDIARGNRRISGVYVELQNYPKGIAFLLMALQIDSNNHFADKVAIDHYALADAYENAGKIDSAFYHINIAMLHLERLATQEQYVYSILGHVQLKRGELTLALLNYRKGLELAQQTSDLVGSSQLCADLSALYKKSNQPDSAIHYAVKGFDYGRQVSFKKGIIWNAGMLSALYDSTNPSLALHYYKIATSAKDSLLGLNSLEAIQNLVSKEEAKQKELDDARVAYQNKIKLYGLIAGLTALLLIAAILFRNNLHRRRANQQLQEKNSRIENTLSALKSTQAQLIQSEKMASLGQLTAGIAHEIQNPLNFVNNFSEVNGELLNELKDEMEKGNIDDAHAIVQDVIANSEKITQHGKRADAIVKGMLQHSQAGSGKQELTDINSLADEYLRLAYHGLRGKDSSVNVTMKTDFDNSIGKINITPQDIGRVLLNLYNNAFYTVTEKSKSQHEKFDPVVTVTTKRLMSATGTEQISIAVNDNGNGIAQPIVDKIFQPFFTTKPTGQGTGLGLSLSYDIIKAHGGEIKVTSNESEGSQFTIILPAK